MIRRSTKVHTIAELTARIETIELPPQISTRSYPNLRRGQRQSSAARGARLHGIFSRGSPSLELAHDEAEQDRRNRRHLVVSVTGATSEKLPLEMDTVSASVSLAFFSWGAFLVSTGASKAILSFGGPAGFVYRSWAFSSY